MIQLYTVLGVVAFLLLLSVVASKAAVRLGVPTLLLFLGLGMAAGSEGIGGLWFDYPRIAQGVGVVALVYILYAAGFDTNTAELRPQMWPALSLATLGVFISWILVAVFSHLVLSLSWAEGALLGAIISSTDAAAVFGVFRAKNAKVAPGILHLIEGESGANDPMAVFLTFAGITAILSPHTSLLSHVSGFFIEMGLGAAFGFFGGKAIAWAINRIRLQWEGLYPVMSIALVLLLFTLCSWLHGNGFLAVYGAGLVVGSSNVLHQRSLSMFHDGLAWLLQIAMFLILGLQVYPSQLWAVAGAGVLVAVFLILVARPLSVLVSLAPFRIGLREKLFVGWAGLRGAAPIILATIAVTSGVPGSQKLFHLVFFVAALSVAIQGTTLDTMARRLGVLLPAGSAKVLPAPAPVGTDKQLMKFAVPEGSTSDGTRVMDLHLPQGVLILLVSRDGEDIIPSGGTVLLAGDVIQVLASPEFTVAGGKTFGEAV